MWYNIITRKNNLAGGLSIAKQYFDEKEGSNVPKRKVRAKLDELLRKFILEDGFDI